MTNYEELKMVLKIMKKHDLPISPILEYSIKEKMDKYSSDNCASFSSVDVELDGLQKSISDYEFDFANMSVGVAHGKKLPHKAIVLLSIIDLIQRGILNENKIKLDDLISNTFKDTWEMYLPSLRIPSVWIPFWYLKSEPFWHFKAVGDENVLDALLMFGGHPSIGQMRPVIDYAFLDDDLFNLLQKKEERARLKKVLLDTYFQI